MEAKKDYLNLDEKIKKREQGKASQWGHILTKPGRSKGRNEDENQNEPYLPFQNQS